MEVTLRGRAKFKSSKPWGEVLWEHPAKSPWTPSNQCSWRNFHFPERGWEDGDGKRLLRVMMRTKPSGHAGSRGDTRMDRLQRHDCLARTGTCYCFPSCAVLKSCWPEATGRISYTKLEPRIPVLTGANLEQEWCFSLLSLCLLNL